MKLKLSINLLALLATMLSPLAYAEKQCKSEAIYKTTTTFLDVDKAIKKLGSKWDSRSVLLVFDIDSTLLTMTQDLGSDQWIEWQTDLLINDPKNSVLTGESFPELFEIQNLIWNMGKMRPPEKLQPSLIQNLQTQGFTTLLLTSRAPEDRDITVKTLKKNNYDFEKSTLPPLKGFSGEFTPYNTANLSESGITTNEAINMGLGYSSDQTCINKKLGSKAPCFQKPRRTEYTHGVFFTTGQHKGAMLRNILHKTGFTGANRFQAIVYVDDKAKHVKNIYRAFCNQPVELGLFHYTHEADRIEKFVNGDKTSVINKWRKIEETLKLINKN